MKRTRSLSLLAWLVPLAIFSGCGGDDVAPVVDTACQALTDTGSVIVGSGVRGRPGGA